jgi:predicted dehydrogenase
MTLAAHEAAMPAIAPIRTALIGYGYVGRTFHAPLIRAVPGLDLVAIGSSRPPNEVHETAPGVTVLADPHAAATWSGADLIIIATPNDSHAPLAEAALAAGKHVVVDKPFTITLAEARRLADASAASGTLLSVFQNRRWDSDFLTVKSAIESGRLGAIVQFDSHIDRFRPVVQNRWRERPGPGAGLWFDLGPHLLDQAFQLFGLPDLMTVNIAQQRAGATAPDWFHAVLSYPRLRAVLQGGMLVSGGSARFTLHGTVASLVKGNVDVQESQLRAGVVPGDLDWGIDLDAATLFDGATGETEIMAASDGDYRRYYGAVVEAIRGEAPNPVTPAEAVAVMAALETGERSAAEGRFLSLPLTDAEVAAFYAAQRARIGITAEREIDPLAGSIL